MDSQKEVYIVYGLRYGDKSLGTQFIGVFSTWSMVEESARKYNDYRGGKYPVIEWFITPIDPSENYVLERSRNLALGLNEKDFSGRFSLDPFYTV